MAIHPIFDTNSIIKYRTEVTKYFHTVYFPSIVFFELIATSTDKSTFDLYSEWHRDLKKENRIITPTENDWWETAKAIRRLYLSKAAPQTKLIKLRMDALIARLVAKQKNALLVTDDVDDFQIIKREMKDLRVISANEFFA
jgi:predicted nucleic acid-binding protein